MLFNYGQILIFWFIFFTPIGVVYPQNLLNGPEDIVFDVPGKRMLVSNWVSGAIVQIDSNSTQSYFKTGLSHAHGMELVGDTLYIASDSRIVAIRLADALTLFQINIPVASRLGHITIDNSRNLYATDWSLHKIFKVDLRAQTYSTIVQSGIDTPVGIMVNSEYNRLILCQFLINTPPHAVSLSNYAVTPMGTPHHDQLDAIVRDPAGNFYLSVWSTGEIIRYNSDFSNTPEFISSGHDGPSGLGYDASEDILGVTNYNNNSISLIPVVSSRLGDFDDQPSSTIHLHQNYPNPFNPTTTIKFELLKTSEVSLEVLNILGEKEATLLSGSLLSGSYQVDWNAFNLTSGVYLYHLEAEGFVETRKMVLMK